MTVRDPKPPSERLIKIGAKALSYARCVALHLAEVASPPGLFADILRMIAELGPRPLFAERGFDVDHRTINRWVLAYAPEIEKHLRQFRRPHCG